MSHCYSHRQDGFSYVGLLITILIVGVMSAAALSAGSGMQRRVAEDELLFIGEQFQSSLKSYADATPPGGRPYPRDFSELMKDPRFPVLRRHLRKVYADPLTGSFEWGIVEAPGGGILGVYSTSVELPIKVTGFGDKFTRFAGATHYSDWVFSADLGQQSNVPRQVNSAVR